MPEVSTFRLYLLRATYLLIVIGLGFTIWPGILHPPKDLALMRGVVRSLLGAVSLPLLFFELLWKSIGFWRSDFPSGPPISWIRTREKR